MKHRVYGKKLGRDKNERTALFKNLVQDLILHEKIKTTEAKAKAIKGLVDRLITQAKSPNTKRLVAQFLVNKDIQEKLFSDIAPRLKSRVSGYTSVIKLGKRLGDGAMIVQMRLLTEGTPKSESRVKSPPAGRAGQESSKENKKPIAEKTTQVKKTVSVSPKKISKTTKIKEKKILVSKP